MFRDQDLILADDQAVTGDANSANVVDLGASHEAGNANVLYLIVQVTDAFTAGEGTVQLRTLATEARGTPVVVAQMAFTAAELMALGTRKHLLIPPGLASRYWDVRFDMGPNGAGGAFSAWISTHTEGYQEVESGYKVAQPELS